MMRSRRLFWQIFPAAVLTVLLAIIAVTWYCVSALQEFHLQETERDLEARAVVISDRVKEYLHGYKVRELRDYCKQMGRNTGTRITVILPDGKVVADSNENPDVMDNHQHRVEIAKALGGEVGVSRRFSKTLQENLVYVALPLQGVPPGIGQPGVPGVVAAVLRTSVSVASLDRTLAKIQRRITIGAVAVMLLAGFVTLLISRSISKPLEQMTKSAEQFASGDFTERMLPTAKRTASFEVVTLAGAMDRMAELLDEKIQAIITHRNQLETVFSSMIEAVIAIDKDERVISINDAAAELFDVQRKSAPGKIVQQIVRNVQLQEQINNTLATGKSAESEIVLLDETGDRFLQTNVVTLCNGVGENVGVLVVMNDVTRIRRLENIRQDFVANVSHELRTPITSIRGYVETLLDGALDSREDAEKFLEIVLRQSERLSSIIDDLLSLSRIEEEAKRGEILLEEGRLCKVIESALQTCQLKAEQSGVALTMDCPEGVVVEMNKTLLEQAVVNLVVNGVTYSRGGGTVSVEVGLDQKGNVPFVKILVIDHGCGIAKEHLPRLFERFYRSDKARSRSHGGTGLGLAIVKHIAQAHHGSIEVTSVEGEGSVFTLTIPGVKPVA